MSGWLSALSAHPLPIRWPNPAQFLDLGSYDDRFDYEEDRFITLGMLQEIVVVIAHTERDEMVRIISMRKATKNEQRVYFESFTN